MAKKASVYTRSGDKGQTSLVGGTRIKKSDPQIDLYGEVDELNSFIGLCCSYIEKNKESEDLLKHLYKVQSELFDLGSNLACEVDKRQKFSLPKIDKDHIKVLEDHMDQIDSKLEKLEHFVLPGGCKASSVLHICRTVCRRLERKMVGLEDLPDNSLEYINRLSDYFFILARYMNKINNIKETRWIP